MRLFDPDRMAQDYQFKPPVVVVQFLAGVALARFHAYLLLYQEWVKPLLVAIWAAIAIIALFAVLSAYQRYLQGVAPLGEGEGKVLMACLIVVVVLVAGYAMETSTL